MAGFVAGCLLDTFDAVPSLLDTPSVGLSAVKWNASSSLAAIDLAGGRFVRRLLGLGASGVVAGMLLAALGCSALSDGCDMICGDQEGDRRTRSMMRRAA